MATSHTAVLGLKDEVIDKLRELRRLNIDSAKGFEECADLVDDAALTQAFQTTAHTRREQAQALGTQIEWNDDAEEEQGSYLAAMHRSWIRVREAIGDSTESILSEVTRGEESIRDAYAEAVKDCRGSGIHDLIAAQHDAVEEDYRAFQQLCKAKGC